MMRNKVDEHGDKMFTVEEYLTKDQVLSQFAQTCAKMKRGDKHAQIINEQSQLTEPEDEVTNQEVEVLQYILIHIFI